MQSSLMGSGALCLEGLRELALRVTYPVPLISNFEGEGDESY